MNCVEAQGSATVSVAVFGVSPNTSRSVKGQRVSYRSVVIFQQADE